MSFRSTISLSNPNRQTIYVNKSRRNACHTITRGVSVLPEKARHSIRPYPALGDIVRRAHSSHASNKETFSNLQTGDLIFAGAIVADERIRANEEGFNESLAPLVELINRGLFDRGQTEGRNLFEEKAMRYAATMSTHLFEYCEALKKEVRRPYWMFLDGSLRVPCCRTERGRQPKGSFARTWTSSTRS